MKIPVQRLICVKRGQSPIKCREAHTWMAMGWKQYTVSKDPTKLPCLLGTLLVSVH